MKTLAVDATWLMRRQFSVVSKESNEETKSADLETQEVAQEDLKNIIEPDAIICSFLTCLIKKIREDFNFHCETILLWDKGTYRYRPKNIYSDYKSNKKLEYTKESYQVCWDAINKAAELTRLLGFKSIRIGGLEADDLGMYYSHNRPECILWTIDSDWMQSISPTSILHRQNTVLSYSDICEAEEVEEPFDLAIKKAILGNHDNLKSVGFKNMSVKEAIQAYKDSEKYSVKELDQIEYNLILARLDRILSDEDAIQLIKSQETLTKTDDISYLQGLSQLKTIPNHLCSSLNIYHSTLAS